MPNLKPVVGIYLGIQPSAGGMFQYAQSVLKSLADIREDAGFDVIVAYGDERWVEVIKSFELPCAQLKYWKIGTRFARLLMAMLLPKGLARLISKWLNPIVKELNNLRCDVWIFPAQDELTWHVNGMVVATIHDLMHRYGRSFPEAGSWLRYWLREYRFRTIANQSSAVLVDSEMGKTHVIESYRCNPEKIYSLPYIAPNYMRSGVERIDFELSYKLPTKFYFYPAQYWQHKNHRRLIEALAEARQVCGDMALVLSGGFEREYESVRQQVSEAGLAEVVRFVGYVPDGDMAGFYRRARGLVMPTFFGPTNIPPLEAMAIGCPVLISEIYAMPDQCGEAALYFNPNSVAEIRDRMIRLWTDDRLYEQLIAHGRMRTEAWGQPQFEQRLGTILTGVLQQISGNQSSAARDCDV